MKTLSKFAILSLSATLFTSMVMAQPYPAYQVLDDLTDDQVTQLKQLGHLSSNDNVDELYDAKVQSILTPEQYAEYTEKMLGSVIVSDSSEFDFDLDSK